LTTQPIVLHDLDEDEKVNRKENSPCVAVIEALGEKDALARNVLNQIPNL
jgi:hypothetical protein